MFQVKDDGRCPDQACRVLLAEKDYVLGLCPACDGMLPSNILRSYAEKIERRPVVVGK